MLYQLESITTYSCYLFFHEINCYRAFFTRYFASIYIYFSTEKRFNTHVKVKYMDTYVFHSPETKKKKNKTFHPLH